MISIRVAFSSGFSAVMHMVRKVAPTQATVLFLGESGVGKEVLADLLGRYAPCVILIDELVAYVRQFEEGKTLTGGSFDSNLSFIQALTEALKAVPTARTTFASTLQHDAATSRLLTELPQTPVWKRSRSLAFKLGSAKI